MKKYYQFSAKLKECETVFREGFAPGIVATQEISFNLKPGDEAKPTFWKALRAHEKAFLKEFLEVDIREIKP